MEINEVYDKLMIYPKSEIALRLAHMLVINEEEREKMRSQYVENNGFAYEYPPIEDNAIHHP